jgi:hypothetical protein
MPHPTQTSGFSIPSPVHNGQQMQSVPMPVQNGYAPPLPAPFYNGGGQSVGVPMSHPVQGGSFTIPGPVYNGGYGGPQTPSESYWNEVDGYRSIGQSSPVFGNQSYGTYEAPSAPQQGFTIGAAPRVVFVPQYAPQPYAAPAQQQQFTIPQQYPGNVAPTYAADVVGAANYAATAAKDKVALDYIYRDSTRRGRTGMATTAKALGSRTLGIFGWLIGYDTACAPVSANSCR